MPCSRNTQWLNRKRLPSTSSQSKMASKISLRSQDFLGNSRVHRDFKISHRFQDLIGFQARFQLGFQHRPRFHLRCSSVADPSTSSNSSQRSIGPFSSFTNPFRKWSPSVDKQASQEDESSTSPTTQR